MRQSLGQQQQQQQERELCDYGEEDTDRRMSKKAVKVEPRGGLEQDANNHIGTGKRKSPQVQPASNGARKRERRAECAAGEQQMTQPQPQGPAGAGRQEENVCAACGKPIRERYLLVALDKRWHEDCLKCACCDCRLGEVGSSLFTHSDKILCRRDFLRIFGQHGLCATCKKSIPPYELVMRAGDNAYHIDCFACQQCQYRFCVGDQFQLDEQQRIVCLGCHLHDQQPLQLELGVCQRPPEAPRQVPAPAAEPATEVGGAGRPSA